MIEEMHSGFNWQELLEQFRSFLFLEQQKVSKSAVALDASTEVRDDVQIQAAFMEFEPPQWLLFQLMGPLCNKLHELTPTWFISPEGMDVGNSKNETTSRIDMKRVYYQYTS